MLYRHSKCHIFQFDFSVKKFCQKKNRKPHSQLENGKAQRLAVCTNRKSAFFAFQKYMILCLYLVPKQSYEFLKIEKLEFYWTNPLVKFSIKSQKIKFD